MPKITLFEHDKLYLSHPEMDEIKLNSLLRYNELHGNKYFEGIAKGIKVKQYVGVIQIDGLLLEILPKTDRNKDESVWRNVLLQMLQTCQKVKVQTIGEANLKKQQLNLLEVYFGYYLREVEQLIHSGLIKKYRKETSNVKALKGKLDFAGNIRHNLVHKERFYTTHEVYDVNHRLHQVLNLALEIVDQFTSGTYISDQCKRVRMGLPEVEKIKVNETILNSITLDRKTAPYQRALELAKFIILNYSPDIEGGNQKMIALLFDMNQLWEEYVYIKLKKHNSDILKITGQKWKPFWGSNKLQPDIIIHKEIENNKVETYIIDTKWKLPSDTASVQDLRQMYTYARFWNADKVILLYPGDRDHSGFKEYKNEEKDGKKHECQMAFVSVLKDGKLNPEIGIEILKLIAG